MVGLQRGFLPANLDANRLAIALLADPDTPVELLGPMRQQRPQGITVINK